METPRSTGVPSVIRAPVRAPTAPALSAMGHFRQLRSIEWFGSFMRRERYGFGPEGSVSGFDRFRLRSLTPQTINFRTAQTTNMFRNKLRKKIRSRPAGLLQ